MTPELQKRLFAATGNTGYTPPAAPEVETPVIPLEAMANFVGGVSSQAWTGDKFLGGFGITRDFEVVDYWLLRKRSKQLFTENLYARGMIRRLLTNEINKGLALEATPDSEILGIPAEELSQWAEVVERRFEIWGKSPQVCDYRRARTFGAIQRQARMMAIISGDVLVVLRQDSTRLPNIDLYDADSVGTPNSDTQIRAVRNRGNDLKDGVEIDPAGRHVAFFVKQKNGTYKRVPAYGPRSGRLQAWLYYGTERLINDVRGQSLLGLILQSLKELDRYRDSEQRAAVINSMIAVWVEKTQDKMGSLPLTAGATRRDSVVTQDDSSGKKSIEFSSQVPGLMLQELQHGEKPTSYDTRRPNVNYGNFEAAVINAVAWANEVPPEIMTLAFQNNYSASRGAVNEFKMYLDRFRAGFGQEFNAPIYQDFLIAQTLMSQVDAPGLLEALKDPNQWAISGAWFLSEWYGAIKPNVDLLKEVNAYKGLTEKSWITNDRASRELTGTKFSKNVEQVRRENEAIARAVEPVMNNGLVQTQALSELTQTLQALTETITPREEN